MYFLLVLLPSCRIITERSKELLYSRPRKYIQCWGQDTTEMGYVNIKELAEAMCRYDLDDMDLHWLKELNAELARMGEWCYFIILSSSVLSLLCKATSSGPVFPRITHHYIPCSRA